MGRDHEKRLLNGVCERYQIVEADLRMLTGLLPKVLKTRAEDEDDDEATALGILAQLMYTRRNEDFIERWLAKMGITEQAALSAALEAIAPPELGSDEEQENPVTVMTWLDLMHNLLDYRQVHSMLVQAAAHRDAFGSLQHFEYKEAPKNDHETSDA